MKISETAPYLRENASTLLKQYTVCKAKWQIYKICLSGGGHLINENLDGLSYKTGGFVQTFSQNLCVVAERLFLYNG